MTPSLETFKDDFDNSQIVRQAPVSAASSLSDAWHTLGFEWRTNNSDIVIITAGTNGIVAIRGVAFKADDKLINGIESASRFTDFGPSGARQSEKRFALPWADFLTIAHARTVRMRLEQIDSYSVSSFGPDHPQATVNGKFEPFISQVNLLRNKQ
jgi:hypothetical protein